MAALSVCAAPSCHNTRTHGLPGSSSRSRHPMQDVGGGGGQEIPEHSSSRSDSRWLENGWGRPGRRWKHLDFVFGCFDAEKEKVASLKSSTCPTIIGVIGGVSPATFAVDARLQTPVVGLAIIVRLCSG